MNLENKKDVTQIFKGVYTSNTRQIDINVEKYSTLPGIIIDGDDFSQNEDIYINGINNKFSIKFNNSKFKNIRIKGTAFITFDSCVIDSVHSNATDNPQYKFINCKIKKITGYAYLIDFDNTEVFNLSHDFHSSYEWLDKFKTINCLIFDDSSSGRKRIKFTPNINSIKFDNFSKATYLISNFNSGKEFELIINESDLSNITFFNCDLSKSIIRYNNSKITELKYVNSTLPYKAIEIYTERCSIEAYRQLKIVSKKHYDRFNELKYKSLEQDAYMNSMKLNFKNLDSWIVLRFNKYSNNHGTMWAPALILILILGFCFYCWYVTSITNIFSYKDFWLNYPQFISPFHKMELLGENYTYSMGSNFIDIFHRIINYFLIYQGVQAFRKYGKD